jgi:integrase
VVGPELSANLEEPDPSGLRKEMRDAVHARLYPYDLPMRWSKATIPTLASLAGTRPYLERFLPVAVVDEVLHDSPGLTPFEAADGQPLAAIPATVAGARGTAFAAAFRLWVAPAAVGPQTRARYDGGWNTVVTYAIAYDMLPMLWPSQPALLESLLFFGIALEMQAATLLRLLTSVRARHNVAETTMPVHPETLQRWRRAMRHGIARLAQREYLPVRIIHLHRVLEWPCADWSDVRNKLLFANGTILGPRPSELLRVDVCDVNFGWRGEPGNTVATCFYRRKNDLARKGHFPRMGQAVSPARDVVAWLRLYFAWTGFRRHPECSKKDRPMAPCHRCGLLFRRADAVTGRPLPAGDPAALLSTMELSTIVRGIMHKLGEDPLSFRSRSLRHGCITAGFEAGIPEYLVYLQTGHRGLGGPTAVPAGRRYAALSEPSALYALWRVFGL